MRTQLLALLCMLFVFSSCTSRESRINSMVEKEMKNTLTYPETYEPINTVIDTAYAPLQTPDYFKKVYTLCKLGNTIGDLRRDIDYSFNDGKKERLQKKLNESTQKAKKLISAIKADIKAKPTFYCIRATHNYRATTNGGQTRALTTIFLLDEEGKAINFSYSPDEMDMQYIKKLLELITVDKNNNANLELDDIVDAFEFMPVP